MIEIICNEENSDKSKQVTRGAAIRRPKNIKQIGEVSSDKKIYIEDYAFTYINSIAYNNPSDSQAGVLLGENQTDGDEKCVFIKGIIKAKLGTEVEEKGVYFNESVWNGIYSDVEKYFPDLSVVGWFAAAAEEKTEFDVELTEAGDQKVKVIKVVREITGLGLKEAKEVVDGAPKVIKEAASKEEAEEIKAKLEAASATVEIK